MAAVMTLMGRGSDWATAKKALGEGNFLTQVLLFSKIIFVLFSAISDLETGNPKRRKPQRAGTFLSHILILFQGIGCDGPGLVWRRPQAELPCPYLICLRASVRLSRFAFFPPLQTGCRCDRSSYVRLNLKCVGSRR